MLGQHVVLLRLGAQDAVQHNVVMRTTGLSHIMTGRSPFERPRQPHKLVGRVGPQCEGPAS